MENKVLCTGFWSRTKTIIYFFVAYVVAFLVMNLILDGISFAEVFKSQIMLSYKQVFLERSLSSHNKFNYLLGLLWDFPYMIAYGGLLIGLIIALGCRTGISISALTVFVIFPINAVLADAFENILEVIIVYKYPAVSGALLTFSVIVSIIKWTNVVISLVVILYLLVRRFI